MRGASFFSSTLLFCPLILDSIHHLPAPSSPVQQQVAAKPRDFVYQTVDCFTRPGSVQMVHEEEATVLKGEAKKAAFAISLQALREKRQSYLQAKVGRVSGKWRPRCRGRIVGNSPARSLVDESAGGSMVNWCRRCNKKQTRGRHRDGTVYSAPNRTTPAHRDRHRRRLHAQSTSGFGPWSSAACSTSRWCAPRPCRRRLWWLSTPSRPAPSWRRACCTTSCASSWCSRRCVRVCVGMGGALGG